MDVRLTRISSKKNTTGHWYYWLSALIPFLTVFIYFAIKGAFPFGQSSLLTTDMGQEYIDFYAYVRRVLLGHPHQFLYTFSSSLGGPMLGTWAYYLLSPFNLILLLTPGKWITVGVWLITCLKIATCGLTMFYYLQRRQNQVRPSLALALSTAYALCGYNAAYQLDIMWLEGVILLPLIMLGLERLVERLQWRSYLIWLCLAILTNYYIGYMLCLFSLLYFAYLMFLRPNWRQQIWPRIGRFAGSSLLAGALNMWLIWPTWRELQSTKATYNAVHWDWNWEYSPLSLLPKLSIGSYSFDQMSSGQANIFTGTLVVLLAILFFTASEFSVKKRLLAGGLTTFLILSFMLEPLDLLWHGGQFPVWYPSRFSFIFSAWLILLAAEVLTQLQQVKLWQLSFVGGLLVAWLAYLFFQKNEIDYLTNVNLALTAFFALVSFLLLLFYFSERRGPLLLGVLSVVLIGEALTNYQASLEQISYTKQTEYWSYTSVVQQTLAKVSAKELATQRTGRTFNRDNDDPMQFGIAGGDHFNSMLNPIIGHFYDKIGQAAGDNFVNYKYGTQVTDGFLGFKTWLTNNEVNLTSLPHLPNLDSGLTTTSYRPDVLNYPLKKTNGLVSIRTNQNALSLLFAANEQLLTTKLGVSQPVLNQEKIVGAALGERQYAPLYSLVNFDKITLKNLNRDLPNTSATYTKKDSVLPGTVTFSFTPTTNNAYYLALSSSVDSDALSLSVNGENVPIDENFRDTILLNVARRDIGKPIKIVMTVKKDSVWLQHFDLYQLDQQRLDQKFKQLKKGNARQVQIKGDLVKATVTVKKNQLLMTTIPANSGWSLKVDGKAQKTTTALQTFLAAQLTPGTHQITLRYRPDGWRQGWLVTILAVIITGLVWILPRQHRQRHY
ncbi:YfhO family protein [Lapidilactobacillus luobeiensis]|uniref:YfhO family protein n=1 Tax=Lapidilactobacillus luobeiensis TaxID=2950371 RepID=UPI0021C3ED94|nr:YfhO family protein [Lapidilactobacillus luobeiensis]